MAKKKSKAKVWFLIHSWLALPIWGFIFFVCLTGSIATVSQEIEWLASPMVRANPPAGNPRMLTYDEVLARVEKAHPGSVVKSIRRPVKSQFALTVNTSYQDGKSGRLYVNPYTGEIQGQISGFDFRQFVRALHGWLLVPFTNGFAWGWYAVALLGIPMLISLITGLVVYKRFWRGYLKPRLRIGQGARIFWGDFHRLAGIWSVPFIAIISVTAIWFLIEAILFDNSISISTAPPPAMVQRQDVPTRTDGSTRSLLLSPDQAVAKAKDHFPDMQAESIFLPANAYSHYTVMGRSSYPLILERASVNPYTGNVDASRTVSDYSGLELVTESMRPLHTGDFAGLWLKLVYFFFGVLLTMMVLSGMLIWTKRTAKETAGMIREHRESRRKEVTASHSGRPSSAAAGGQFMETEKGTS
ncbi:PepSY-associated TM helix domain-containing protein [Advenella mimigardefordensis]|uniref:Putative peptidase, M4 family n=1 Tax=Advenella mimigardefordensis (strain DSM 17166 / LMG 22922 / DPN7) TaxID=1247726 RepID=W0PCL9_ADVMD|nr:PepSY-associated TM helix domain-containing protein [Advenella mimigardefordensis]AHG64639.1 putative peptidase, M4 family [Advenella mimigardefordensis DPN7]